MAEDEERDLGDIVLSWSVRQIMDDDHYKGQVLDRRALGCGCLYGGCRHERFGCVLLSFLVVIFHFRACWEASAL
jgi:hypothetical protein